MNAIPRRVGVIGWPVAHSLSPLIHQYWMHEANLPEKDYEAIPVPPNKLVNFLEGFVANGFVGCNVTLPHKESVFSYIKSHGTLNNISKRLHAVNIVVMNNKGKMEGRNSDGFGFIESIRERAPSCLPCEKAVVLGAGGSAHAILAALQDCGVRSIIIINRTRERAEKLIHDLDILNGMVLDKNQIDSATANANILVNTTNLGMIGAPSWKEGFGIDPTKLVRGLAGDASVIDIVYTPLQTELLRVAKKQGLVHIDGLGMLIHQAIPSFEAWFGVHPKPTSKLRNILEEELHRRGSFG